MDYRKRLAELQQQHEVCLQQVQLYRDQGVKLEGQMELLQLLLQEEASEPRNGHDPVRAAEIIDMTSVKS